ncbi:hypothetical protein CEX98_12395 [Pseudoalteromonas piscicida]|uniref:Uncharacterized protein n=1 Tax=Pseudoalteromonas piscicida TaxID=43662 RepID=A0A2A5JQ35_PSEO7|nr:hypothetical protein CEX98_12395 [Pseudoalteromonas piscicida]
MEVINIPFGLKIGGIIFHQDDSCVTHETQLQILLWVLMVTFIIRIIELIGSKNVLIVKLA